MNISFIVPAFNCALTIEDSIASIYSNNFEEGDEVIIVDDASFDNTLDIIQKLKKKYPCVRDFRHHINKGSAAAGRNTGIDNALHDLIFCLDADNILVPGSIKALKEYLVSKKADVASFGEIHYILSENKEFTHKWVLKEEISFLDNINTPSRTPCSSGNYLFTKESWRRSGRYMENIGGAWDSWAFGTKQLATGSKMVTLSGSYYLHRYGHLSAFMRDSNKFTTSLIILQVLIPFLEMLHPNDVNYITSEYGRNIWYDLIEKRPIRLKDKDYKLPVLRKILNKWIMIISKKIYN